MWSDYVTGYYQPQASEHDTTSSSQWANVIIVSTATLPYLGYIHNYTYIHMHTYEKHYNYIHAF